jgi:methionyl aminopeptidase
MELTREVIRSAYVHKKMVKEMMGWEYEGLSLLEVVKRIEERITQELPGEINRGIAFPVGIGINHCVAHYSPLLGNTRMIQKGDLLKIDFGVHVKGEITDSAFTIGVNTSRFDELIQISREATMIGVKMSGPEQRLAEIGEAIEEYVTSKEIEIGIGIGTDSQKHSLKTMRELCGHSIAPYTIHAGKAVPNCKLDFDYPARMKWGERYAIEPFVTTGEGLNRIDRSEISHYMIKTQSHSQSHFQSHSQSRFYHYIRNEYQTLPFNRRWIEELAPSVLDQGEDCQSALQSLVDAKIVEEYPPIYDVEGSYVAQTEHNVWIGEKRAYPLTTCVATL